MKSRREALGLRARCPPNHVAHPIYPVWDRWGWPKGRGWEASAPFSRGGGKREEDCGYSPPRMHQPAELSAANEQQLAPPKWVQQVTFL